MFLRSFTYGKESKFVNVSLAQELVLGPDKIELVFSGGDHKSILGAEMFPAFAVLESMGVDVVEARQAALQTCAARVHNAIAHIPGAAVEIGEGSVRVRLPEQPANFAELVAKWRQYSPIEFF